MKKKVRVIIKPLTNGNYDIQVSKKYKWWPFWLTVDDLYSLDLSNGWCSAYKLRLQNVNYTGEEVRELASTIVDVINHHNVIYRHFTIHPILHRERVDNTFKFSTKYFVETNVGWNNYGNTPEEVMEKIDKRFPVAQEVEPIIINNE